MVKWECDICGEETNVANVDFERIPGQDYPNLYPLKDLCSICLKKLDVVVKNMIDEADNGRT